MLQRTSVKIALAVVACAALLVGVWIVLPLFRQNPAPAVPSTEMDEIEISERL